MIQAEKLAIIKEDPWMDPYSLEVQDRFERYKRVRKEIEGVAGSLLLSCATSLFSIKKSAETIDFIGFLFSIWVTLVFNTGLI